MSDPSGWLWVILAVLGVGGLGLAIAYGSAMWAQRRRDLRQAQDEAVRDNYRQEEVREKRQSEEQIAPQPERKNIETKAQSPIKSTVRTRGGVTEHNVRYVLAFGLAGIIIAFIVIAIYFGSLPY